MKIEKEAAWSRLELHCTAMSTRASVGAINITLLYLRINRVTMSHNQHPPRKRITPTSKALSHPRENSDRDEAFLQGYHAGYQRGLFTDGQQLGFEHGYHERRIQEAIRCRDEIQGVIRDCKDTYDTDDSDYKDDKDTDTDNDSSAYSEDDKDTDTDDNTDTEEDTGTDEDENEDDDEEKDVQNTNKK